MPDDSGLATLFALTLPFHYLIGAGRSTAGLPVVLTAGAHYGSLASKGAVHISHSFL